MKLELHEVYMKFAFLQIAFLRFWKRRSFKVPAGTGLTRVLWGATLALGHGWPGATEWQHDNIVMTKHSRQSYCWIDNNYDDYDEDYYDSYDDDENNENSQKRTHFHFSWPIATFEATGRRSGFTPWHPSTTGTLTVSPVSRDVMKLSWDWS